MTALLGTKRRGGSVVLTPEERSRHVQVLGASGTGKSKLLESLIRQDILNGRGLCLIDPHGTLADPIMAWCASRQLGSRRIHYIEPGDSSWIAAFNPLRLDCGTEPSVRVDAMVDACAQVWGGEDTARTPLLKKCLRAVFYALAVRGLTLVEAVELIGAADPRRIRHRLTEHLPDYVYDALWADLNALPKRDFAEQFSSTNNRLLEFLNSATVRRIVGQREHALDLRRVMDAGDIVIVNLALKGTLSPANARLLGTLLTSELFLVALGRDAETARRRPFTLYIDECADYLTDDIVKMLDQTRKFGLHLVLGHQRLGQLRRRSEDMFNGVMTGTQTKIVFGGLADDDADVMAREIFRSSFNLERPKVSLNKPVVVDEVPYWLDTESWTEGTSSTSGISEASGWSTLSSLVEGRAERWDAEETTLAGVGLSTSENTGRSESGGYGRSETRGENRSYTNGRSQALKSMRVMLPTQVHTLEEETHLAMVKLRELPNRAAIVKRRGRPPVRFTPTLVRQPLNGAGRVEQFVSDMRRKSPYGASPARADAEIELRQAELLTVRQPTEGEDAFWQS